MFRWSRADGGENLSVDLGVGLPGLRGDDPAVANGRLVGVAAAAALHFDADVRVTGDRVAVEQTAGGEHLNAVADGADGLVLCGKLAQQIKQAGVVAEVFGRASAGNDDGYEILGGDGGNGDVGLYGVAGPLHVGFRIGRAHV